MKWSATAWDICNLRPADSLGFSRAGRALQTSWIECALLSISLFKRAVLGSHSCSSIAKLNR